jgi:hypothetical protein
MEYAKDKYFICVVIISIIVLCIDFFMVKRFIDIVNLL